uniref:Uncharacterized protein n=1 Tax=Romanomermis culicivorax TaxID=13658 RepID=A0A915K1V9_ROMCU
MSLYPGAGRDRGLNLIGHVHHANPIGSTLIFMIRIHHTCNGARRSVRPTNEATCEMKKLEPTMDQKTNYSQKYLEYHLGHLPPARLKFCLYGSGWLIHWLWVASVIVKDKGHLLTMIVESSFLSCFCILIAFIQSQIVPAISSLSGKPLIIHTSSMSGISVRQMGQQLRYSFLK